MAVLVSHCTRTSPQPSHHLQDYLQATRYETTSYDELTPSFGYNLPLDIFLRSDLSFNHLL